MKRNDKFPCFLQHIQFKQTLICRKKCFRMGFDIIYNLISVWLVQFKQNKFGRQKELSLQNIDAKKRKSSHFIYIQFKQTLIGRNLFI